MEMKIFFQKLGIGVVTVVTLGLLVWAMFLPESNVWWNTYLATLVGGFVYFLVKFVRDVRDWDNDGYGLALSKLALVAMAASIFGSCVQAIGLHFQGNSLTGDNVLPADFGLAWGLLLLALCLMAIWKETKEQNTLAGWFVISATIWLLSMQVAFAQEGLRVLGYTIPAEVETVFSVVYPVLFFGTAILAFACVIVGIFRK